MIPRSSSAIVEITSGRPSCSIDLISCGIARQTRLITPRWRKAFTRKRLSPLTPKLKSTSFSSVNSSSLFLSLPSRLSSTISVSSGVSGSAPGIGSRRPCRRISGFDGTFRWRSDPSISMTRRRAGSSSNMQLPSETAGGDLSPGRAGGRPAVRLRRALPWRRPDPLRGGPEPVCAPKPGRPAAHERGEQARCRYCKASGRMTRRHNASGTRERSTRGALGGLAPQGEASPWRAELCDVAELLRLGERLQLLQRLVLDLADALACDVERAAHLVERARVLAAEAVAQLEHAALAVGEVLERLAQRLLGEDLRGAVVRRLGTLVGDELAELGLLLVTHRLLERDGRLGAALDRVDLVGLDASHVGDLLGRRLAAELRDELALGAPDLVELLDDVDRDADRARLVGQRTRDRLADPPGRVGRELEALAVVELLGGAHEAERALLDQVEERQPLVAVVLRDRDHESQVRLDHLLLRVEVAALDALGEVDFLLS